MHINFNLKKKKQSKTELLRQCLIYNILHTVIPFVHTVYT